ncbi:MAG: metallophosphatase family protein [Coriobacteriales bacterium]|jgi:putative phosphoesterase|nr:metallophosphatase family protein [Coriobacteriales bacterium]
MADQIRLGLISDTHGRVAAAALAALSEADLILHAGDIGSLQVILDLEAVAPLEAVLGNCDHCDYGRGLERAWRAKLAGVPLLLCHRPEDIPGLLGSDPARALPRLVVHGHTHRPRQQSQGGVLYLNPGSASRPRGGGPGVMLVELGAGQVKGVERVTW